MVVVAKPHSRKNPNTLIRFMSSSSSSSSSAIVRKKARKPSTLPQRLVRRKRLIATRAVDRLQAALDPAKSATLLLNVMYHEPDGTGQRRRRQRNGVFMHVSTPSTFLNLQEFAESPEFLRVFADFVIRKGHGDVLPSSIMSLVTPADVVAPDTSSSNSDDDDDDDDDDESPVTPQPKKKKKRPSKQ